MNLANNIKNIRKENNLSQEQLAEQLGVSRQAISKWESGQSYPEMEKILLICKMYNFSIDELMNDNIKEVSETKQTKININKYIEDFFDFITRFVSMLSAMSFKEKIKCLFEQVFNAGVLFGLFFLLGLLCDFLFINIFSFLDYNGIYIGIKQIFESIYVLVAFFISAVIMLHIFKIRYLDYYESTKPEMYAEKESEPEIVEEKEYEREAQNNQQEDIIVEKRKFFRPKYKQKVIIRDPRHTHSGFLVGIVKLILSVFKIVAGFFGIGFSLCFAALTALLVISFLFIRTGLTFLGVFFLIIAMLIITFVILNILYNFIAVKKNHKTRISVMLLISLILTGLGTGLFAIGITSFNITDDFETQEQIFEMEMNDNLTINSWYPNIEYKETNSENIKIVTKHSEFTSVYCGKYDNHIKIYADNDENFFKILRASIDAINNKTLCFEAIDTPIVSITVYTSKENIEKLKNNYRKYYEDE